MTKRWVRTRVWSEIVSFKLNNEVSRKRRGEASGTSIRGKGDIISGWVEAKSQELLVSFSWFHFVTSQ